MGNVSREMKILRKNQKEMLQIKNTIREMMIGLLLDYTWLRKESLSLRISQ